MGSLNWIVLWQNVNTTGISNIYASAISTLYYCFKMSISNLFTCLSGVLMGMESVSCITSKSKTNKNKMNLSSSWWLWSEPHRWTDLVQHFIPKSGATIWFYDKPSLDKGWNMFYLIYLPFGLDVTHKIYNFWRILYVPWHESCHNPTKLNLLFLWSLS